MIIDKTNEIIKKENIHAKKMFGQNFLKDKNVLNDIIKAANLKKEDNVIEIGPGLGALTEKLCECSNKVLCYEIDDSLAKQLPSRLKDFKNYNIINQDFLERNLSNDLDEYFGKECNIKVVANIPYNITSPIMLTLLKEMRVKEIILMVQKELAERFASAPGNKEYGSISAYLNYLGENKIVRIVSRNCFNPIPNVDSAVYSFTRKRDDINEGFLGFLRISFKQKRKKLSNNLDGIYGINKNTIIGILEANGFSENIRAEELSSGELYMVYKILKDTKNEN